MSRLTNDPHLTASVLDRLIREDPVLSAAEYREVIRRDLEHLLNTRCAPVTWPSEERELDDSLLGYGLPELASVEMGSAARRAEMREIVERVIRRSEPRLSAVRVELIGDAEPIDRVLRFRIEATLRVGVSREHVTFDTSMKPTTMMFEIRS